jgi:hypothetical protein
MIAFCEQFRLGLVDGVACYRLHARLADSRRRQAMAAAMRSLARPNAAAEIVDRLEKLRA